MRYISNVIITIFIVSCMSQPAEKVIVLNTPTFITLDTLKDSSYTIIIGCTDSTYNTEDTALILNDAYYNPYLVIENIPYKIEGFEENWVKDGFVSFSPNGKFFVMGAIEVIYMHRSETERFLYEKYYCLIINIEQKKVVEHGRDLCMGDWDKNGNWIW